MLALLDTYKISRFSSCAPQWSHASASELTELQALVDESPSICKSIALRSEAEPRGQCFPRQSLGTRIIVGGVYREVLFLPTNYFLCKATEPGLIRSSGCNRLHASGLWLCKRLILRGRRRSVLSPNGNFIRVANLLISTVADVARRTAGSATTACNGSSHRCPLTTCVARFANIANAVNAIVHSC